MLNHGTSALFTPVFFPFILTYKYHFSITNLTHTHTDYSHPNSLAMPTPVSIVDGETASYHDPQYSHHSTAHLVSSYGTYQTAADYHVQSAMTPPSSVSPRDTNTTISHSNVSNNNYTHCPNDTSNSPNNAVNGVIGIRCNRSL